MAPQTPNSSKSKLKSFKTLGSPGDTNAHRPKPFQLPTPPQTKYDPPTQSQFTFSPKFPSTPTKVTDKPKEKSHTSTTSGQDANELKKGYGIDFPDDSEDDILSKSSPQESPSKDRGRAWVGVRNPSGHFEKVLLQPAPAPHHEATPSESRAENVSARRQRPIATPRSLRKPAAEKLSPLPAANSGASAKTTSTSCQTSPPQPRQRCSAKAPAPYVEEAGDEDDKHPRKHVEPISSNSRQIHSSHQSSKTVLPSPPQTPSPPPKSTQSTKTAPVEMGKAPRSLADDATAAADAELDDDSELEAEVSTLHSWNWRLVGKRGNFEIRSPTPSPASRAKKTPDRPRRGGRKTASVSPGPPPPSPLVSSSLSQMKAAATVTLPRLAGPVHTEEAKKKKKKKKWTPPRFARREDDPRTSDLALMLGRMGFALDKGDAREAEEA